MRLALLTAALLAALAPAAAGATRPRGSYSADGGRLLMVVTGRSIQLASLEFTCRGTRGRTALNDIPIRKVRGRWRFSIYMFGSVAYRDGHPDENAPFRLSGRFSPSGRTVVGLLRARTPYCGRTRRTLRLRRRS